jgi:hypothetical protein
LLVSATEILTVGSILTIRTILTISATMPSAPPVSKSILPAVTLVIAILSGILLRLRAAARNKCRKATDVLSAFMAARVGLRIGLLLMLLVLLRTVVQLLVTRRKWLRIARQIGLLLRLPRHVARFVLTHERLIVVIVAVEAVVTANLRLPAGRAALLMRLLLIVVWVLLAKLLLRGGDQAEVGLGVLIVVLGGHRIARPLCVTRELYVFFRDVRSGAADFDIGTVRFVNAREGILTFAVVASPPHALLTVSHDVPVRRPFNPVPAFAPNAQLNLQVQTNLIARPDLRDVRANDRNVVSLIAIVAATPLPRSQPQRC